MDFNRVFFFISGLGFYFYIDNIRFFLFREVGIDESVKRVWFRGRICVYFEFYEF